MIWQILAIIYGLGVALGIYVALPIVTSEPTDHGRMILVPLAIVMVAFWPLTLVWILVGGAIEMMRGESS